MTKTLSLFVDKWFITGAVVTDDGRVSPLTLPNGEDRVWLYFFEDRPNHSIVYSKRFEAPWRDRQPFYIGDIFPLLEAGNATFCRFHNNPEEINTIFTASGIFDHFRQALEADRKQPIDVYISFSTDIPDVARLKFLNELKECNFNEVVSVARISHLALEESALRKRLTAEGNYLVFVATNENLHYLLFRREGGLYVRSAEGVLPGYGHDVRRRALVETVVENINRTAQILKTHEEIDHELLRLERFADEWLRRLALLRPGMPLVLSDVCLAAAPYNRYNVAVRPTDLDSRTSTIVDNIVRNVAHFVRETGGLQTNEVKGFLFVGDTFTNKQFAAQLANRFVINDGIIERYTDRDLPRIVAVYPRIDNTQFTDANLAFLQDAEAEAQRQANLAEDEKRRKQAEEEKQRQDQERERNVRAEREYNIALDKIDRFERDHEYEQMGEWADIALTHRPNDDLAKEKKALAQQMLANQRAAKQQYNTLIASTRVAMSEKRWSDAVSQCQAALTVMPNDATANSLMAEAKRYAEAERKVNDYLTLAKLFFAQESCDAAIQELEKALSLDADNQEAHELKLRIEQFRADRQVKIQKLVDNLEASMHCRDYDAARSFCEELIKTDTDHVRQWIAKAEEIKLAVQKAEQTRLRLIELRKEIYQVDFKESWSDLKRLCDEYLTLMPNDDDIANRRNKAEKKLEEETKRKQEEQERLDRQELRDAAIGEILDFIGQRSCKEAEEALRRFRTNFPEDKKTYKELFARYNKICDLFGGLASPRPGTIGFKPAESAKPAKPAKPAGAGRQGDSFFTTPSKKQENPGKPTNPSNPDEPSDDFFAPTNRKR